jgi:hypothetical protein
MKLFVIAAALAFIALPFTAVPVLAIGCPSGTSQYAKVPAPPAPPIPVPYPVCIEHKSANKRLPMPPVCTPPKFALYRNGGWVCKQ